MALPSIRWLTSVSELPTRPYRNVAFYAGDVREFVRRLKGPPLELRRNDLGWYYVAGAVIDGIPVQFVGLAPFIEEELTVVADPAEAVQARALVAQMLADVKYHVSEVPNRWAEPDDCT